jgi:hypothetical protein
MRILPWPRWRSLSVWRLCQRSHSAFRLHLHCHRSHCAGRLNLHCRRSHRAGRPHLRCQRSHRASCPHLRCQRSHRAVHLHCHCQRSHNGFHFHWSSSQLWHWCQIWMVCSFCNLFVCLSYCPYMDMMRLNASSCSLSQSYHVHKKAMHASWLFPQFGWPVGQLAQ